MDATPRKILIIIPTYNEKENIELLTKEVLEVLPQTHILIVDDNSPDGTGDIADNLCAANDHIHVIHGKEKGGLGTAYIRGFHYAIENAYDVVMQMDADFSHQPKYLPEMLRELEEGYDLVIGSRYIKGGDTENWGFGRKFISKGGNLYSRTILGIKPKDITAGFKCFRREVLENIEIDEIISRGFGFQIEVNYRVTLRKYKIGEIAIVFPDRVRGDSKMSGGIFSEALINVWKLKFNKKLRKLKKR